MLFGWGKQTWRLCLWNSKLIAQHCNSEGWNFNKKWLVGWLMAWDVLVDICRHKTKCRVHFFGVKTWLVGWLVGKRLWGVWIFGHFFTPNKTTPTWSHRGSQEVKGGQNASLERLDTFCGWLQIFLPFQGGPVGPEDFAPNSGCRRFVVYIRWSTTLAQVVGGKILYLPHW